MTDTTMTTADFFYRNDCPEFREIKNRIWEFNNPTAAQLAEWRSMHWAGSYGRVVGDIRDIGEQHRGLLAYCEARFLGSHRRWAVADFAEFAFGAMEAGD